MKINRFNENKETPSFNIGSDYGYDFIENWVRDREDYPYSEETYMLNEYGVEIEGQHFLVITGPRDFTASFVLTGVGGPFIYTCIYLYPKK